MKKPYHPSAENNPSVLARRSWWQTQLVNFIVRHTPRCRDAIRLFSQGMEQPLPLVTRVKLRVHKLVCAWCSRYDAQIHELRRFTISLPEHLEDASPARLDESVKARLKNRLAGRS